MNREYRFDVNISATGLGYKCVNLFFYWLSMTIMPKKKSQHRGKVKHAVEESEFDAFSTNRNENTEEEYTTVVDFESKKSYNKRLIESNWSRYEEQSTQGDEPHKTEDLNYLLQIASSDCAHFEFSSEKLWRSESNSVPANKIFNLDLDVLSGGLACLPFHERMGLHESELSAEDRRKFHEEAERNRKEYASVKQSLTKKLQDDAKMKNMDKDLRSLSESMKERQDLGGGDEENEKQECSKSTKEGDCPENKTGDKVEKRKQNIIFSENENLEGWLDSVLDD